MQDNNLIHFIFVFAQQKKIKNEFAFLFAFLKENIKSKRNTSKTKKTEKNLKKINDH